MVPNPGSASHARDAPGGNCYLLLAATETLGFREPRAGGGVIDNRLKWQPRDGDGAVMMQVILNNFPAPNFPDRPFF
jgi:hypothetical protein